MNRLASVRDSDAFGQDKRENPFYDCLPERSRRTNNQKKIEAHTYRHIQLVKVYPYEEKTFSAVSACLHYLIGGTPN